MYFRDYEQEVRKKNYLRYQKLSERGFSVSSETALSALYVVNEDPLGRTYYKKPLGQVAIRDPITGQTFMQEDWATKEFIIDNKVQLINKASADLLVGKEVLVDFPDDESAVTDEMREWLVTFKKDNKLQTKLYEAAIRNSAFGDQFFEARVEDGKLKLAYVDPYYVDVAHDNGEVISMEIAWEIEIEASGAVNRSRVRRTLDLLGSTLKLKEKSKKYVQKKTHYPGYIQWELLEVKGGETTSVPLSVNPANEALLKRAVSEDNFKMFLTSKGTWMEEDNPDLAFIVVEFTGIDELLLVHWPNYRMFKVYGESDTGMVESLQNALNSRETQLNDVLDKHADPTMYGDDAFLDENGNLVMSEGGGRYFPVQPGGVPPDYLTWDSHLDECQTEITRLYRAMAENTELSPALLGTDTGGVESGRALMYKLIRSLAMVSRKGAYLEQAVKDVFRVVQKLQQVWVVGDGSSAMDGVAYSDRGEPFVEMDPARWDGVVFDVDVELQSSLPTDVSEVIRNVGDMLTAGMISKETAVDIIEKYFDEIDATKEVARITAEGEAAATREAKLQRAMFASGVEPGLEE